MRRVVSLGILISLLALAGPIATYAARPAPIFTNQSQCLSTESNAWLRFGWTGTITTFELTYKAADSSTISSESFRARNSPALISKSSLMNKVSSVDVSLKDREGVVVATGTVSCNLNPAPSFTGTSEVGSTLTGDTDLESWGVWGRGLRFSYEWQVSDDGISGWSTAPGTYDLVDYVPPAAVGDKYLRLVVAAEVASLDPIAIQSSGQLVEPLPESSIVSATCSWAAIDSQYYTASWSLTYEGSPGKIKVDEELSYDYGSTIGRVDPQGYVVPSGSPASGTYTSAFNIYDVSGVGFTTFTLTDSSQNPLTGANTAITVRCNK